MFCLNDSLCLTAYTNEQGVVKLSFVLNCFYVFVVVVYMCIFLFFLFLWDLYCNMLHFHNSLFSQ